MRPLIDWPYPDRPKLPQLRAAWQDMRREGLANEFRRIPVWGKVAITVLCLSSFALTYTLVGWAM